MISVYPEEQYVSRIQEGAQAFINKHSADEELPATVMDPFPKACQLSWFYGVSMGREPYMFTERIQYILPTMLYVNEA